MNSSKVYASLAGCALAVAGLSGCFVTTDTGPGPPLTTQTGTVTVVWTVTGSRSPVACSQFGADELEVVLRDRAGRPITTAYARCTDFTLTVPLPPGNYQGEVTLVDTAANAVTTTLPLRDVRILSGSDLTIDVDFPSTTRI